MSRLDDRFQELEDEMERLGIEGEAPVAPIERLFLKNYARVDPEQLAAASLLASKAVAEYALTGRKAELTSPTEEKTEWLSGVFRYTSVITAAVNELLRDNNPELGEDDFPIDSTSVFYGVTAVLTTLRVLDFTMKQEEHE